MGFGKQAELLATKILEGRAYRLKGVGNPYDIYWADQNRRVEVKAVNISSKDIGKKTLKADIRNNWGKNDYYFIMIYIDDQFDHCYLIGSPKIEYDLGNKRTIVIPSVWSNFKYSNCLYAFNSGYILGGFKYTNEPYDWNQLNLRKHIPDLFMLMEEKTHQTISPV